MMDRRSARAAKKQEKRLRRQAPKPALPRPVPVQAVVPAEETKRKKKRKREAAAVHDPQVRVETAAEDAPAAPPSTAQPPVVTRVVDVAQQPDSNAAKKAKSGGDQEMDIYGRLKVSGGDAPAKYVPPAMRLKLDSARSQPESAQHRQLQRYLTGTLNKLSEMSMDSVMKDVLSVYTSHSTMLVTEVLTSRIITLARPAQVCIVSRLKHFCAFCVFRPLILVSFFYR